MGDKTYNVWVIYDIAREGDYSDNIKLVESFSSKKLAFEYESLLSDIDEIHRNYSRNPDWGFHFFVQINDNPCYMIIDCDEETPRIYSTKKEAKDQLSHESETIKEIHLSKDSCDHFDDSYFTNDYESDEESEVNDALEKLIEWKKENDE
jgi:hypothetical protein